MSKLKTVSKFPTSAPMQSLVRITPKNESQAAYIDEMEANNIVFCGGPAGCGKTFLSTLLAIRMYQTKAINKIVLVRPAVEACGEKLGFLPGDLLDKMDPFLCPIFDAMNEVWQDERIKEMIEEKTIDIVPLGYMRGRTFRHSFVITDEAQNMSEDQMIMLLTRIGEGSKMVISGDESQNDLGTRSKSGLQKGLKLAGKIPGIGSFMFKKSDSVRHALIGQILEEWENLG